MGSADDRTFNGEEEIAKLKERLKLVNIEDIIGKAKMHAAEAYSHAKEAYNLRDEFFKLIEQHAGADLDSGTKERLSFAAASLNAALGVADAAVATANIAVRAAVSAHGKPSHGYNLLASSEAIPRAYESMLVKDEKATNLVSCEREDVREATKDLISEDIVALEDAAANIASNDADSVRVDAALEAVTDANVIVATNLVSYEREEVREATKDLISEDIVALEDAAANIASSDADSVRVDAPLEAVADANVIVATNLVSYEREEVREATKDLISEDIVALEDAAANIASSDADSVRVDAPLEAVADANVAASDADSDQGKPSLDYNLLASSEAIPRAYESMLVKDEKATNLVSCEREDVREATEDLISEDIVALEVAAANIASNDADSVRVDAALEAVADANVAASDANSDQDNPALIAASTNLDSGERSVQREAVREALARDKKILLRQEEIRRLEEEIRRVERMERQEAVRVAMARARVDAAHEAMADANVAASDADSDQDNPGLIAAFTKLDFDEGKAHREAVREALARANIEFLRDEENRRLEEEGKAEKERKKKKREEENKMRDDKRKQKMDKNTKPKDKDKGKGKGNK